MNSKNQNKWWLVQALIYGINENTNELNHKLKNRVNGPMKKVIVTVTHSLALLLKS